MSQPGTAPHYSDDGAFRDSSSLTSSASAPAASNSTSSPPSPLIAPSHSASASLAALIQPSSMARSVVTMLPRARAKAAICASHYLHSFPSGWTVSYAYGGAVVVFSIPANKNLGPFLFSGDVPIRELARLWAPDAHAPNLLTQAISASCAALRRDCGIEAVVSFADPNHGHHGGVYQAASWTYTGQSSEARVYRTEDGRTLSRRAFHSGSLSIKPTVPELRLPGKHRYVRPLTRKARKALRQPVLPYPKSLPPPVEAVRPFEPMPPMSGQGFLDFGELA